MKIFPILAFLVFLIPAGAEEFRPKRLLPPVDPITDPSLVPATEAQEWVGDDELVVGVVIGEEARAYPINQLTRPSREIINDKLGGRSIAATW